MKNFILFILLVVLSINTYAQDTLTVNVQSGCKNSTVKEVNLLLRSSTGATLQTFSTTNPTVTQNTADVYWGGFTPFANDLNSYYTVFGSLNPNVSLVEVNTVFQCSGGLYESSTNTSVFIDKIPDQITYSISDSSFVNGVKTYTLTDGNGNDQTISFTDTDTKLTEQEVCDIIDSKPPPAYVSSLSNDVYTIDIGCDTFLLDIFANDVECYDPVTGLKGPRNYSVIPSSLSPSGCFADIRLNPAGVELNGCQDDPLICSFDYTDGKDTATVTIITVPDPLGVVRLGKVNNSKGNEIESGQMITYTFAICNEVGATGPISDIDFIDNLDQGCFDNVSVDDAVDQNGNAVATPTYDAGTGDLGLVFSGPIEAGECISFDVSATVIKNEGFEFIANNAFVEANDGINGQGSTNAYALDVVNEKESSKVNAMLEEFSATDGMFEFSETFTKEPSGNFAPCDEPYIRKWYTASNQLISEQSGTLCNDDDIWTGNGIGDITPFVGGSTGDGLTVSLDKLPAATEFGLIDGNAEEWYYTIEFGGRQCPVSESDTVFICQINEYLFENENYQTNITSDQNGIFDFVEFYVGSLVRSSNTFVASPNAANFPYSTLIRRNVPGCGFSMIVNGYDTWRITEVNGNAFAGTVDISATSSPVGAAWMLHAFDYPFALAEYFSQDCDDSFVSSSQFGLDACTQRIENTVKVSTCNCGGENWESFRIDSQSSDNFVEFTVGLLSSY